MEAVKPQTPSERFKAANDAISEHCFKSGRIRYEIELEEEALEKKKLEYRNMRVDFDRLRKEFMRAQEEAARAANESKSEAGPDMGMGLQ